MLYVSKPSSMVMEAATHTGVELFGHPVRIKTSVIKHEDDAMRRWRLEEVHACPNRTERLF